MPCDLRAIFCQHSPALTSTRTRRISSEWMTLDDEQRAQLDGWWQRRSPEERAALIEDRRGEFSAGYVELKVTQAST